MALAQKARQTGSPAEPLVSAHVAPVGDGTPNSTGSKARGDGKSNPFGGRASRCTYGSPL